MRLTEVRVFQSNWLVFLPLSEVVRQAVAFDKQANEGLYNFGKLTTNFNKKNQPIAKFKIFGMNQMKNKTKKKRAVYSKPN